MIHRRRSRYQVRTYKNASPGGYFKAWVWTDYQWWNPHHWGKEARTFSGRGHIETYEEVLRRIYGD